ncbi:tRNA pseudouridine(65) synthase TruC, partial [Klebsiella pneumoniae]|nr:tRNA pseudouridine(65) synthase TruC [Klebsiella pneumoniae]
VWMRALSEFVWRGILPLNECVEFAVVSCLVEDFIVNRGR